MIWNNDAVPGHGIVASKTIRRYRPNDTLRIWRRFVSRTRVATVAGMGGHWGVLGQISIPGFAVRRAFVQAHAGLTRGLNRRQQVGRIYILRVVIDVISARIRCHLIVGRFSHSGQQVLSFFTIGLDLPLALNQLVDDLESPLAHGQGFRPCFSLPSNLGQIIWISLKTIHSP